MEEMMGFVTGNRNRQKLLEMLGSKGDLETSLIAKNMHLAQPSVKRLVEELVEKKLIVEKAGKCSLTELGTTVERKVQNL
ncbi:helix-turn-helix domain-containing protein [Methanohalophilus halophilus]|uniref:Transcriptional regulator n=2 Tax=Methanohalophilus halophilus TaxID=2177 RepID=A0A1L3Q1V8_9EURY|nr:transcriptional regulator [Methanohalophilus halophilus]APH38854.1 transcriptional regulator [Methanohalophilus halophilus]